MEVIAIGVTCPIMVLNANEVIAPNDTPFSRIAVPKSSAGMDQLSGPLVMKNTKSRSQPDVKPNNVFGNQPRLNSNVKITNAQ